MSAPRDPEPEPDRAAVEESDDPEPLIPHVYPHLRDASAHGEHQRTAGSPGRPQ